MINSIYDLAYINDDGTYVMPSGPCMGWPLSRNQPGPVLLEGAHRGPEYRLDHDKQVQATTSEMASGLLKSAIQVIQTGKADKEVRNKRMDLCSACEHFILDSKQCSQCGCFMVAKTWIKAATCPIGKW